MALEHDSKGFLIGDAVDFKESNKRLIEIRDEIKSLRESMVFGGVKLRDPKQVAAASQRAREMPRANGKFVSKNPPKDTAQSRAAPIENTQLRNNGRFASQSSSGKSTSSRFLNETASRFGGAAANAGGRAYEFAKQTDPMVQALSDIGGPLASSMRTLFSSRYKPSDEGVPWYKRIFKEIRFMRRENTQYSKAERAALKKIEDKPNGGSRFFGGGGLLGSLFGGGEGGGGMLGSIAAALGLKSLLGGGKSSGGGMLSKLKGGAGGLLKGLARRIPLLSMLFAGYESTQIEGNNALSGSEKALAHSTNWGGAIGATGGGLLGSLLGPAGAIGGSVLGNIVGEKIGAWLHDSKIAESITTSWDDAIKVFNDIWKPITEFFKDKLKIVTDTVDDANNAVKKSTGIDVKGGYSKAVDFTSRRVIEPAADMVSKTSKSVKDRWQDAKGYLKAAAEKVGIDPGVLAKIANYESKFNPNAMPITKSGKKLSSAHGYGQFLDSTWTDYVNKYGSKYGIEGAGNLTKAQAAKYRGNKDIQAAMLAEFTKENVEKGRRLGGKDDDANVYALHNLGSGDGQKFLNALKQNPNAPVSSVLSNAVISGNPSLYGNGSISIADAYARQGQSMRQGSFFANDIRQPSIAMPQAVSVAKPPFQAKTPTIAEAPAVVTPLMSPKKEPLLSDQINNLVGPDVNSRPISHIITGGYSRL